MTQVNIIGGGITGLSSAIHLVRLGASVRVFDKVPAGDRAQASFGNAGILAASAITPLNTISPLRQILDIARSPNAPVWARFRDMPSLLSFGNAFLRTGGAKYMAQVQALNAICSSAVDDHLALNVDAASKLLRHGRLGYIYNDERAFEHAKEGFEIRKLSGFELSYHQGHLAHIDPAISEKFQYSASFEDHAWIVDPGAYMEALYEEAERLGAVFIARNVEAVNGGAVRAGDWFDGDFAVLCAGARSRKFAKVPLHAERGYHLFFEGSSIRPNHPFLHYEKAVAVTPMRAG